MTLVRTGRRDERDVDRLRAIAADLEALLATRARDVARVRAALAAFTVRYRAHVGLLHEELEELEHAIADAELGEIAKDPTRWRAGTRTSAEGERNEPAARYTIDGVRKLFRDVAKAIHPDLASDEAARERRHALMVEANRAYSLGDEERLRWILDTWHRSPEAVEGGDPEATRLRLVRRIGQIEEQLAALTLELDAIKDTPMWKLKVMVDEASARGSDLIRETVRRLRHDILVARNRLDAIRYTP